MVIKKSHSSSKTKTTKAKKVSKAPVHKSANKVEPYHPFFGILLIFVSVLIASVLVIGGIRTIVRATFGDAQHFAEEYTQVDADNVFKPLEVAEIINTLEHGTGVVFLGFPECAWCQAYAPMLDSLAKEHGISEIYYYNIKEDRESETEDYKKIVELLSSYLQYDNTGSKRVYVPETAFIIEGEVVGNDYETSKNTLGFEKPEDYWTEERIATWKHNVGMLMDKVKSAEGCTTTCNE